MPACKVDDPIPRSIRAAIVYQQDLVGSGDGPYGGNDPLDQLVQRLPAVVDRNHNRDVAMAFQIVVRGLDRAILALAESLTAWGTINGARSDLYRR
jgi:hypothetical protein